MKSLLTAFALVVCPALLHAQVSRTWVSGVGDDNNPCSRTAPGLTFAGALPRTAPGGVIDVLDPGDFESVTIGKSVTLDGVGAPGSIAVSGSNAIMVDAGVSDIVVLRNLRLDGLNSADSIGVLILQAGTVIIENCQISGFATGISLAPNAMGAQVVIKDSTIQDCTTAGISLAPPAASSVSIDRCHVSNSGQGVSAAQNTTVVVTETVSAGNTGAGFITTAPGAIMALTRCTASDNQIGIQSGGLVTINDCAVIGNLADGLKHSGGKINSYHNNKVLGNHPDGASTTSVVSK